MKFKHLIILTVLFSSCTSFINATGGLTAEQQIRVKKIVEAAYQLNGKKKLVVKNKTFRSDCTGAVAAVYHNAGIDITKVYKYYTGGGVTRLYKALKQYNLLYYSSYPKPGDIIFWDNTWDKNGDRLFNDYLTHTGVVLEVKRDGTITYAHYHYVLGFRIEKMNLLHPNVYRRKVNGKTEIVNYPMRAADAPKNKNFLASQLTRKFGMGYILPDKFEEMW